MFRRDIPGSTYRVSNASIVSSRKLFGRQKVVTIQFTKEWATKNPLYDWYIGQTRLKRHVVHAIQLRKERKQPFLHEYLVLYMGNEKSDNSNSNKSDNGNSDKTYFRLERRQLENEDQPLASLLSHGVEAYDTLEETIGFEDPLTPSDCLAQLDFTTGIHIAIILEICRAIHKHPSAKVYTLQRFNCYFFAQNVLLCSARATYQSNDMTMMIARIIEKYDGKPPVSDIGCSANGPPLYKPPNSSISPLMMLKENSSIEFLTHNDYCSHCWRRSLLLRGRSSGCNMYSVENLQGLFWDGASGVIEQVLGSINAGSAFQNVLWSTDSGPRLENICNAFMFWTVHNEWDMRLDAFQRMLFEPIPAPKQPELGYTEEKNTVCAQSLAATQENLLGISLEHNLWSQLQAEGAQHPGFLVNDHHQEELRDFLSTSYFASRKKLMELVGAHIS
ncbi:unnamed protein product [Rhizoctonia solani]|uniref:Uncharacterized protein n=1 Tax=Rhizoctonia solani TaxID=456999 RepID=A0A8H3C2V2_9AGAM|nr:unnamed protein product [Rhizoctonia solani]